MPPSPPSPREARSRWAQEWPSETSPLQAEEVSRRLLLAQAQATLTAFAAVEAIAPPHLAMSHRCPPQAEERQRPSVAEEAWPSVEAPVAVRTLPVSRPPRQCPAPRDQASRQGFAQAAGQTEAAEEPKDADGGSKDGHSHSYQARTKAIFIPGDIERKRAHFSVYFCASRVLRWCCRHPGPWITSSDRAIPKAARLASSIAGKEC